MEYTEALEKLKISDTFKEWKKSNAKSYLTHAFTMVDPGVKEEWQIGYYNPDEDSITTFAIADTITKNPESEAFKEEKKISGLDTEKVSVTFRQAMDSAEKIQKEKYSAHTAFKKIVILQNLDVGQVWNITYVTNTFKTLNIKIDAATGALVKDELVDLFRIEK